MTALRCKPGDLAVVVDAFNTANLGMFVRVIGPQDLSSDLVIRESPGVWLIEAPYPMTWVWGKKIFHRTRGPALDSQLRPIRGLPTGQDGAENLKKVLEVMD